MSKTYNFDRYKFNELERVTAARFAVDIYKDRLKDRLRDLEDKDEDLIENIIEVAFLNGIAFGRMISRKESDEIYKRYDFKI